MDDKMKRFDRVHIWLGQLLSVDPGHTRFINATKATVSLISSIFTMLFILYVAGDIDLIPIVISGMVGMMSIIIVMDDTKAKRQVTTPLIGLSAAIGIAVGALLAKEVVF